MQRKWVEVLSATLVLLAGSAPLTAAQAKADELSAIEAYAGTWKSQTEHFTTEFSKAGKEAVTLRNDCWRSAGYFACDKFVDGESKALLVFTHPAPGENYISYVVPTDGHPANTGKLIIQGNTWTFPWEDESGGKPVHFRVVNVFTAPDTIENRQEFSRDGVKWTITAQGTEKKVQSQPSR